MADWRALHDSWDNLPEKKKQLIENLFKEKPKDKLASFFEREPYAKLIYEDIVGVWEPLVSETSSPTNERTIFDDAFALWNKLENMFLINSGNKNVIILQILALAALLGAEIAHYNLSSISFLGNVLPFIFLALALAFGLASGIYNLKQPETLKKTRSSGAKFHD